MTPTSFVADLKKQVRDGVASTIEYLADPPVPDPPHHLGEFSAWFRSLADRDKQVVEKLIQYAAEGALFDLLGFIDNLYLLPSGPQGRLKLNFTDGETIVRLNDPEGDLLQDLFNNSE